MDPDLGRFPIVWAAAGTPTAVFPVAPGTLRMLSNAHVAPICEDRDPSPRVEAPAVEAPVVEAPDFAEPSPAAQNARA